MKQLEEVMDELIRVCVDCAPLLVFCLCCYAIVRVMRELVEGLRPTVVSSPLWNPWAMNVMPLVVGVLGALPPLRYPFPEAVNATFYRLSLGLCLGFLSSMVYKAFRVYVNKKLGIPNGPSDPPASEA